MWVERSAFASRAALRGLHAFGLGEAQFRSDRFSQFGDALHLVVHGAELLVEVDRLQLRQVALQRLLPVFVVEEAGIREAGLDHLLVARPDQVDAVLLAVAHSDEVRHQLLRAGLVNGEVALVVFHGGNQHLGGHVEVMRGEGAVESGGLLNQPGHFLQQIFLNAGIAAQLLRNGLHLLAHHLLPHPVVDHYVAMAQLNEVLLRVLHRQRLRRSQGPVGAGGGNGLDAVYMERHPVVSVQGQQPLDGPHIANRPVGPAHGLGPVDGEHQVGEQVGQHPGDGLSLLQAAGVQVLALLLGAHLQVFNRDALRTGEGFGGLGRLAFGVERHLLGRALRLHLHVALHDG